MNLLQDFSVFIEERSTVKIRGSVHSSATWIHLCFCRFNHELVFGVSVKNLSKAERLIYGDSLMTHAMILTAVTDKVRSSRPTLQELRPEKHTPHTFLVSQSSAVCLHCSNPLQFFIILSISSVLSKPSCLVTFSAFDFNSYSHLVFVCL